MSVKSKTQLASDITTNIGPDYDETALKTVLTDTVDSYQDLFQSLTTAQRDAIATPSAPNVIYNSDNSRLEYYNGSQWLPIGQYAGSSSNVYTSKITLSAAQVLDLPNTPVELIAAPGSGYVINVINILFKMSFGSTAYDYTQDARIKFESAAIGEYIGIVSQLTINNTSDASNYWTQGGVVTQDNLVEDDAVVIQGVTTSPVAPTTGDGTLTLWVTYSIVLV